MSRQPPVGVVRRISESDDAKEAFEEIRNSDAVLESRKSCLRREAKAPKETPRRYGANQRS